MTGFVLNLTGVVVQSTGHVLDMTRFVLYMTELFNFNSKSSTQICSALGLFIFNASLDPDTECHSVVAVPGN